MKLLDAKVSHKMLKWIEHYLQQRSGRVRLNGKESRQEAFKHGVPQGGCSITNTVHPFHEQHTRNTRPSHQSSNVRR